MLAHPQAGGFGGSPGEGVNRETTGPGGAQHRQRRSAEVDRLLRSALAGAVRTDAGTARDLIKLASRRRAACGRRSAVAGPQTFRTKRRAGRDGLFGAPVGIKASIDRSAARRPKHRSEFGGQMPGKALGVRSTDGGGASIEPTEPALRGVGPADRVPDRARFSSPSLQRCTHGKARLQRPLARPARPQTVRMIFDCSSLHRRSR